MGMRKETHIAFTLMISSIILLYEIKLGIDYARMIIHIFVCGLGGVIPDFDTKFKHRVLLHNLWALLIISIMLWIFITPFDPLLPIYFIAGYLSHLLLDSLTVRGVKWFYPFGYLSGSVVTNSLSDKFIGYVSFVASLILLTYVNYVSMVKGYIPINLSEVLFGTTTELLTLMVSGFLSFLILMVIFSLLKAIRV